MNLELPEDKPIFTAKECAEILRLNESYCRLLLSKGVIPSVKLGRRTLVPKEALIEYFSNLPERRANK